MKALSEYNKKRNFKKTAEPAGKVKKTKAKQRMFVIQEHHASHLHFDFRLEMEGVLRSWAVPKGPTSVPETKRLAMEVEDHPISYGDFEGTIPEGEYGGGEVLVWDTGTYEVDGDPVAAYHKGHIDLTMKGKRMKGKWTLIRTRGKGERAQWLLFKRSDRYANHEKNFKPILDYGPWKDRPKNWKPFKKKVWHSNKGEAVESEEETVEAPTQSKMPGFIEPELALLVDEPPEGNEWIHETKFDGYRTEAHLNGKKLSLLTRSGLDWTKKYQSIADALKKLKVKSAVLDGEIVVLDKKGHSDFQALQSALKNGSDTLIFYVFDLLYLNGYDLRDQPLIERKKLLKGMLRGLKQKNIRFSDHQEKDGAKILKEACHLDLEGVVSKKADSSYRSGRGGDWVKTKCKKRQEFVIGGYTTGEGARSDHFGSLLLGIYEDDQLRYVGRCGTGFNEKSLADLHKRLKKLETDESPFDLKSPRERDVHFVKPKLAAEVAFAQWTKDKILRVPVFQGLREDKPVQEMKIESETHLKAKPVRAKKVTAPKKIKTKKNTDEVAPELTHPDRVIYAKEKITKENVADFYRVISKHMVPLIADRPLSLKRCPAGTSGECFFQKHLSSMNLKKSTLKNSPIHEVLIQEGSGKRDYATIDSEEGLVALGQLGAFELHAWGCHAENVERPDQIIMDFDPDPGTPFKRVVEAALELKSMLDDLGLKSYLKTSGGKGLHVHIPFAPIYDWDLVKEFSKTLADEMVSRFPDRYTSTLSKKARKGKIFVDYLRNGRSATAVVPYSLRARPLSSVAMPLEWSALKTLKDPAMFTMTKALEHLKKRKKDPWAGYNTNRQKIKILKAAD
jgi:bifunctional non-homologous end joining protein LigD